VDRAAHSSHVAAVPGPAAIRPASVLLVVDPRGRVLAGQRHPGLPFLGGVWSFPGGSVSRRQDGEAQTGGFERAALREFVEETGLDPVALGITSDRLVEVVRWTTPEWSPLRFETAFFHVTIDQEVDASQFAPDNPDDPELLQLGFHAAGDLLERWSRLDVMLAPPAYFVLQALHSVDPRSAAEVGRALRDTGEEAHLHFEPMRGIRMLALETPTLPPATHTNTYILGHERLLVVDPATYDDDERRKLSRLLSSIGRPIEAVFLTHHHVDHIGSAEWLARLTDVPVWAHAETAARVDVRVDRHWSDGEVIDLGRDALGEPFRFELLHTPGHAAGHLCLRDLRPGGRALVCGDMVASIGTIIVDPDDGSMAEYVRQLERLEALGEPVLMPSHGAPILEGAKKLRQYIDHRNNREQRVLGALEQRRTATAAELLELAYADTPREVWPLAERSCLAHLIKLVEDGKAELATGPSGARQRFTVTT
jgi:glyoxylase-like metal-dependent hydrolase (beta-lactamase superfamily II)/8-oxo-dGTP pyrophosphatase MutT (NUDIX family)